MSLVPTLLTQVSASSAAELVSLAVVSLAVASLEVVSSMVASLVVALLVAVSSTVPTVVSTAATELSDSMVQSSADHSKSLKLSPTYRINHNKQVI